MCMCTCLGLALDRRRATSIEFGVPLRSLSPRQAPYLPCQTSLLHLALYLLCRPSSILTMAGLYPILTRPSSILTVAGLPSTLTRPSSSLTIAGLLYLLCHAFHLHLLGLHLALLSQAFIYTYYGRPSSILTRPSIILTMAGRHLHLLGLHLALLSQAFISRIVPSTATDSNPVHVDECSVPSYHYSAVLYLSTSAEALQASSRTHAQAHAHAHAMSMFHVRMA